ncbi:alanine dehydrogenase [Geosporobacter ferrireducens]|uniref:alanine dehydrogenase n=1 Tax=Geosporobacter ferrireducens TaxID=1424294 RepID=A0A1D8GEA2_9FIRM|nr:alanine dehydrogenase [Geosporobacter ferrireducens]AOT69253.1 alanine dehydrogenase [Geosporobacter ferrireducens]MTI56935.1 alanine dehydrogenase [Geosporobacter ferrireducens]
MKIGVLKENKSNESRVIATPTEAAVLISDGHSVLIQNNAGYEAGFLNEDYIRVGAKIRNTMEEIYQECDMVVKVKEFFPEEYPLFRPDQILFACVHPAANKEEVDALLQKKVIAFTAEDTHRYGSPNCEVAGKLGALMGVYSLLSINGGSGKLICGIGGAPSAKVLILGAGIVGKAATEIIASLGAQVTLMDINIGVLRHCLEVFPHNVQTAFSNQHTIRELLPQTDMVINCVKWPKHRKDHLITKDMLKEMRKGSVIVDISADVGGAIETYRPTTHADPTYEIDGILHYGVDNIPGAAPHTTSIAYAASVLPHFRAIANLGIQEACRRDGYLRRSLTAYKGILTHEETSVIQSRPWTTPEEVLNLENCDSLDKVPKATSTVAAK